MKSKGSKTTPADTLSAALWPDAEQVPVKVLECRHCGRRNRVQVPRAILEPDQCDCGACDKPLFLGAGEPLVGIASSAYEHALDRTTLAALKAIPGFPALMRWLLTQLGERSMRSTWRSRNAVMASPTGIRRRSVCAASSSGPENTVGASASSAPVVASRMSRSVARVG